jgi:prephenate dehydrogenase
MAELLPATVSIVGTHPLFGPQSAPESIAGQRVAVCQVRGDASRVIEFLSRLLKVIPCTPEEHDRQMAVSQALTHFIGRAVIEAGVQKVELSTKTFDAMMEIVRVIGGNSNELFEDMQCLNSHAAEARDLFVDACQRLKGRLDGLGE